MLQLEEMGVCITLNVELVQVIERGAAAMSVRLKKNDKHILRARRHFCGWLSRPKGSKDKSKVKARTRQSVIRHLSGRWSS